MQLNAHRDPDRVVLGLRRGSEEWTVGVAVIHVRSDLVHLADTRPIDAQSIDGLGILGIEIDEAIASSLPSLRIPSGVIVAARNGYMARPALPITAGDVIHAINGTAVSTVGGLMEALKHLEAKRPIVLQVERDGLLTFITCDRD
jgi:serine protease Do